jgi:acetolactate synthase-1/2/3 large subunit
VVTGTPLDFRLGFGHPPVIRADAKLIYVDFDSQGRHRPGEVALEGDVRASLRALTEAIQAHDPRKDWLGEIATAKSSAGQIDRRMSSSNSRPIHPARLVADINACLDRDAIVIGDGGDFVSFVGRMVDSYQPGCFLEAGPFGCLGAGIGYATAARLAYPERQVVLFNGDGAFGFAGMDFETLIRERIPIVSVIGNNGIWATEKHQMQNLLGESIAADLRPGVRYDRLVEGLGGYGELVERPEEIIPAFRRALESRVPAVINVLTDPSAEYPRSAALI